MCRELDLFLKDVKKIYGDKLDKIILYGSRARGDYRPDSDFDIMILTSMLQSLEFDKKFTKVAEASYYPDVEINPTAQNTEFFNKWSNASPFYKNIVKEGKVLYERHR